jgi:hypothetical protein
MDRTAGLIVMVGAKPAVAAITCGPLYSQPIGCLPGASSQFVARDADTTHVDSNMLLRAAEDAAYCDLPF